MRPARILVLGTTLALSIGVLAGCSSDSSSKSDKKSDSGVTSSSTTAKTGTPVTMEVSDTQGVNGPMTMTVSPSSVAAGSVTFTVTNNGTIKHEMVVLKTDTPFDQLTVTNGKVSEAGSAGEIGDIEKGQTQSVTLDLKPGKYVLVCNIKKHYEMGMRAAFTVT
jgi:uncharacterized cupredoxin-like copper-binding protein